MTATERRRAAGSGGNRSGRRSAFGSVRKLPSGRYQARYTGPDGRQHTAGTTFDTKTDARGWLAMRQAAVLRSEWLPESAVRAMRAPMTLGEYAEGWIARRDLKPRTRAHYGNLLRDFILPRFGDRALMSISPTEVAEWHAVLSRTTGPTYRAHAYSLLRTLCRTAVIEDVLAVSPCRVRGGGSVKRAKRIEPATLAELEVITEAMPERLRMMVLLAAWCALRFGELAELRRRDIDLRKRVIHVSRGVVRAQGQTIVGDPKSDAGKREVAIPPHLLPALRAHLDEHAQPGRDGLLFPDRDGGQLAHSSVSWHWNKAREVAGRPDLTFHGLRHTGAVLAAQTGATLAELMARLGHSTPSAALRYQHAAQGRDAQIAARLSELAAKDR